MLRRLFTRARELDEFRGDAALAAAFAVAGAVESIFVKSGGHSRPLTAVAIAVLSLSLAWRRRHTFSAVLAFVVLVALASQLNTFLFSNLTTSFIVLLLVAYTVGRHELSPRMWAEIALLAVAFAFASGIKTVGDVLWVAAFLAWPLLTGRVLRSRTLFQREMREKRSRLQAERELRASRAVEDERARIASELQAVVANGVSAMVVQAEAVPRLFENADNAAAAQALSVIEETGRDALAEMRRLLGVLRRDNDGPALAPAPTLARADALLTRMEAEGLDAAITVEGEPVALSPGIDLAGYRVLQEALAAVKRAEGACHADVSIIYGDDNVLVRVSDDRHGSDGLEPEVLRALRERVGLYGGALRAFPRQDGRGFEIEARLPIGGPR